MLCHCSQCPHSCEEIKGVRKSAVFASCTSWSGAIVVGWCEFGWNLPPSPHEIPKVFNNENWGKRKFPAFFLLNIVIYSRIDSENLSRFFSFNSIIAMPRWESRFFVPLILEKAHALWAFEKLEETKSYQVEFSKETVDSHYNHQLAATLWWY